MLASLESDDSEAVTIFEDNLKKQEHNISEFGEKEATIELRKYFQQYKNAKNDKTLTTSLRNEIFKIMEMNMASHTKEK